MSADTPQDAVAAREEVLRSLRVDVIGPHGGSEEELEGRDRPTDVYLTGILFPRDSKDSAEEASAENDDAREAGGNDDAGGGQSISMAAMRQPSSMGLSFSLRSTHPSVSIKGSAGRYVSVWRLEDGTIAEAEKPGAVRIWKRHHIVLELLAEVKAGPPHDHDGPDGLKWWIRAFNEGGVWQVTVVLENTRKATPSTRTEDTFFQIGFAVTAGPGSELIPRRPARGRSDDDDARSAALIYRDVKEWAVGHTCSAEWHTEQRVSEVRTEWLPEQHVPSMSAAGHQVFAEEAARRFDAPDTPFKASVLAGAASPDELARALNVTPDAYAQWLDAEKARASSLRDSGSMTAAEHRQALVHFDRAEQVVLRMRAGIDLLRRSASAFRAYRFAQEAMHLQGTWKSRAARPPGSAELVWRPFQLGFQLLCLASLAEPTGKDGKPSAERTTMDLLWFPTGGGKTEAYLALIAFVAFLRRLRSGDPDSGGGVAVLMRYTLRLLTVQQFERASRLLLACELIRRREKSLGSDPFSIGLWVGESTTPNKVEDARGPEGTGARQLSRCPVCGDPNLTWDARPREDRFAVECSNAACELRGDVLPVWTVDEDVYRVRPTLLLGTIDKFAQIVFNEQTSAFFGGGGRPPPELIIQDELHLISGPLGTVAALYEAAIDKLCEHEGIPAKVVGSTATIRRAEPQVRALFDRAVCQFPPAVIDATDSCFGIVDPAAPGRIYLGVTSAGRSPKFTLQAASASLLQGASELPMTPTTLRDPFWTLVMYFNSLRELGGALVMLYDDVPDSIELYARMHGAQDRQLDSEFLELTSRIHPEQIPQKLAELEVSAGDPAACDVALATNMLSVGVDIPRLGLMAVNGQPKSMSEYIQATSRVGRNMVPGLIVTVYNAGRPRDRSHYESFKTWHQMLYREVEATSVTPFAPRARDKALHAAVVAMVRHRIPGLLSGPTLTAASRVQAEVVATYLGQRASHIPAESAEETQVLTEALAWLDEWVNRGKLDHYKNDYKKAESLLISAEEAARSAALGKPVAAARATPSSMREVEPTVVVRLATDRGH